VHSLLLSTHVDVNIDASIQTVFGFTIHNKIINDISVKDYFIDYFNKS